MWCLKIQWQHPLVTSGCLKSDTGSNVALEGDIGAVLRAPISLGGVEVMLRWREILEQC